MSNSSAVKHYTWLIGCLFLLPYYWWLHQSVSAGKVRLNHKIHKRKIILQAWKKLQSGDYFLWIRLGSHSTFISVSSKMPVKVHDHLNYKCRKFGDCMSQFFHVHVNKVSPQTSHRHKNTHHLQSHMPQTGLFFSVKTCLPHTGGQSE